MPTAAADEGLDGSRVEVKGRWRHSGEEGEAGCWESRRVETTEGPADVRSWWVKAEVGKGAKGFGNETELDQGCGSGDGPAGRVNSGRGR